MSGIIHDLPAAVTQFDLELVDTGHPINIVKAALLDISDDLLFYDRQNSSSLGFKPTKDAQPTMSLQYLSERLQNGKLAPTPVPSQAYKFPTPHETEELSTRRTPLTAENRPLEDYEDMYYAMLARIKDLHQNIQLRINNHFAHMTSRTWTGGPTIAAMHEDLVNMWDLLNDATLVKTLDDAIRRGRAKALHSFITVHQRAGHISAPRAAGLLQDLYSEECYAELPGLAWIGGWSSAMITAWLTEKYRLLMERERLEEEAEAQKVRDREDITERARVVQEYHRYLKELAKAGLW